MPRIQTTITAATVQTLLGARASFLGANLSPDCEVHEIATCANADDCVALPAYDPKLAGKSRTIVNKGGQRCVIFSADAAYRITGAAASATSYTLAVNTAKVFVCIDGANWIVV